MHTIYFVPGLGADHRLFSRLTLEGYNKKFIRWISPHVNENLPDYAKRLSVQIDTEDFSLIGVSFGGMIAVEMSKIRKPANLILISSAKTCDEIPWNLKFFKYFPLYLFLSDSAIRWLSSMNKARFGIFNKDEQKLFDDMMVYCPMGFLKKVMWMVMHWDNTEYPSHIVHIHGDTDYVFPLNKIKDPLIVKGGTHFMPYHNAEEIEKIIRGEISR